MAKAPAESSTKVKREFAKRLKAVRIAAGFDTADSLAKELGMREPETYRRWERGETEPGLANLQKIQKATGASLDFLIAGQRAEEPSESVDDSGSPFRKPTLSRSR